MLPKYILIDKNAPKNGADVKAEYISVREENLNKLLEGLTHITPNMEYTILDENTFKK